jgi:uncharacterized protein (UPF0548 family)
VFRLRAPDDAARQTILERGASASLTYGEVGATRAGALPHGYTHDRYRLDLEPESFARACDGLRAWQAHLGAGIDVYPRDAPLHVGTDVIVAARAGPLHALAPCRVVYVVDEADRFGFAYGTLPGHPERGEEAFVVERDAGGDTTFTIVAFSRPAELLARLGKPVARTIQRRTTHAYLDALRRYSSARRTTG